MLVVGSLNLDLVGQAPRIPAPGETVMGERLLRFEGGKGGNQAVAAARLGAPVRFVGAVGRDEAGEQLVRGLQAEGIDVARIERADEPSGCALITVSASGENAITVLPGANARVPQAAGSTLPPVAAGEWLLLQMEVPLAVNRSWAQAVKAAKGRVMLNAAPCTPAVLELLPWVDLLVVNEGELMQLARVEADGQAAGLAALRQLGPAVVVVTLGARGCAAWQRQPAAGEPEWLHVKGRPVQVIDTTGAGDTFTGALAAGLSSGLGLAGALTEANLAAALSCGNAGARAGMPTRSALTDALSGN